MARYTKKQLIFRLCLIFFIGFFSTILTTPLLVNLTGNMEIDKPIIIAVIQGALCSGMLALVNAIKNYVNGEEIDYNKIESEIKNNLQNENNNLKSEISEKIEENFKEIDKSYKELEEIDTNLLTDDEIKEIKDYFDLKEGDK